MNADFYYVILVVLISITELNTKVKNNELTSSFCSINILINVFNNDLWSENRSLFG